MDEILHQNDDSPATANEQWLSMASFRGAGFRPTTYLSEVPAHQAEGSVQNGHDTFGATTNASAFPAPALVPAVQEVLVNEVPFCDHRRDHVVHVLIHLTHQLVGKERSTCHYNKYYSNPRNINTVDGRNPAPPKKP